MTKVLLIVLAVSVGFNVFFAVGYVRSRAEFERLRQRNEQLQTFEGRCKAFVEKLDLDLQQQGVFEQLLAEALEKKEQLAQQQAEEMKRFLDEIVKDHPDQAVIDAYVNNPRVYEQRRVMVDQTIEFMRYLRPDQRRKLIESIRNGRPK